jgi:hypothetical protein
MTLHQRRLLRQLEDNHFVSGFKRASQIDFGESLRGLIFAFVASCGSYGAIESEIREAVDSRCHYLIPLSVLLRSGVFVLTNDTRPNADGEAERIIVSVRYAEVDHG